MLLGSFDSNLDGAILRKNMAEINDEVDQATGQFQYLKGGTAGIIASLSKLRLYGYDLVAGNYTQNCDSRSIGNGACPSWGNRIRREIVTEGLRFAGKTALSRQRHRRRIGECRPPGADRSRSSIHERKTRPCTEERPAATWSRFERSTFDNDKVESAFTALSAQSAASFTRTIGTLEGLDGSTRLVGNVSGTSNDLCTGKSIGDLSTVTGLCPEAPNMKGTYLGAGAAYWAHTNKIRADITAPVDADAEALKVRQYAVSMAGGSASIRSPCRAVRRRSTSTSRRPASTR